jgi:sugar phosphate permease
MSGLIIIFSALGGSLGSVITGHIFQDYGGETAFYFSLVPIIVLIISLIFFNRLQKRFYTKQQVALTSVTDPITEEYKE